MTCSPGNCWHVLSGPPAALAPGLLKNNLKSFRKVRLHRIQEVSVFYGLTGSKGDYQDSAWPTSMIVLLSCCGVSFICMFSAAQRLIDGARLSLKKCSLSF